MSRDLVEVDESALFAEALADAHGPEAQPEPQPQPQPETGQPRDERGRFASLMEEERARQQPAEGPTEEPKPEAAPAGQEKPQGGIPPHRLAEVTQARKAAEERAAALEAQLQAVMRMMQGQQPQPQPPQPSADPIETLLTKPDEWGNRLVEPVRDEVFRTREFFSQQLAVQRHGEDRVGEAYAALQQAIQRGEMSGQAVVSTLRQSMDPYGEIMGWYDRRRVMSEVGSDPKAWFDKQLEERIKDPAFQASLLEKVRAGAAAPQPTGNGPRPAPVVNLPPSLSRAAAAAAATADPIGTSEADIFRYATSS